MTFYGKITYEIDENHANAKFIPGGWHKGQVFEYDDEYTFDERLYSPDDYELFVNHIKKNLKLIVGGGYNTDHIHNVKFEIREVR